MQTWIRFDAAGPRIEPLGPGACLLNALALPREADLVEAVLGIAEQAPFRHMTTPGGYVMSVALTNAGPLGWTSDRRGYRYTTTDPLTGAAWPPIPPVILETAHQAAQAAGFAQAPADACLINRYRPGARLSLHQDRNERSLADPIISISLGLPARFLFGGAARAGPVRRLLLASGDVVVWGGPSRMAFHGIAPLAAGTHPVTGSLRYNITLRRAG